MFSLITRTFHRWLRNDGMGLAAAVSFYSIFAMVPLFVLVITISTYFLGNMDPEGTLGQGLSRLFPDTNFEYLIESFYYTSFGEAGNGLTFTSLVVLVWAASSFFSRLQHSVRRIFEESTDTIWGLLGINVVGKLKVLLLTFSAGMILAFGFGASSAILSCHESLSVYWTIALEFLSALIVAAGGAIMIRISTRDRIPFKPLAISGALFFVTLMVGRVLVARYLAQSPIASAYGLASSVVIALIWIYVAAILFGFSAALCAELMSSKGGKKQ